MLLMDSSPMPELAVAPQQQAPATNQPVKMVRRALMFTMATSKPYLVLIWIFQQTR
ncbi:MAG: hypothetical protein ACI89J_000445 [Hyphomicrobiaceae bacterium]|jgi:hypothetical protein